MKINAVYRREEKKREEKRVSLMNMALSSITTSTVPDGRDDSLCDLNPPGKRNPTVLKVCLRMISPRAKTHYF